MFYKCVWKTVVDLSNATRNGLITLEVVGGANEQVGGATWPVGRAVKPTLTTARDLEFSNTFAVLRNHTSAGDNSTLLSAAKTSTTVNEPLAPNPLRLMAKP